MNYLNYLHLITHLRKNSLRSLILIIILSFQLSNFSQKELNISFSFDNREFVLVNDTVKIEQLKYYLSNIELWHKGKSVWKEQDSHHLIDHELKNKTILSLRIPDDLIFDEISYNIGIDSVTHMRGAMGGDLDPSQGMYWTWQSGYINFKLEGKTNDRDLTYHIGGFMHPNNSLRSVRLSIPKEDEINIVVDPQKLLQKLNINELDHVMSPGEKAMYLADLLVLIFTIN